MTRPLLWIEIKLPSRLRRLFPLHVFQPRGPARWSMDATPSPADHSRRQETVKTFQMHMTQYSAASTFVVDTAVDKSSRYKVTKTQPSLNYPLHRQWRSYRMIEWAILSIDATLLCWTAKKMSTKSLRCADAKFPIPEHPSLSTSLHESLDLYLHWALLSPKLQTNFGDCNRTIPSITVTGPSMTVTGPSTTKTVLLQSRKIFRKFKIFMTLLYLCGVWRQSLGSRPMDGPAVALPGQLAPSPPGRQEMKLNIKY